MTQQSSFVQSYQCVTYFSYTSFQLARDGTYNASEVVSNSRSNASSSIQCSNPTDTNANSDLSNIVGQNRSPNLSMVSSFWIGRSQEEIAPQDAQVGWRPSSQEIYQTTRSLGCFTHFKPLDVWHFVNSQVCGYADDAKAPGNFFVKWRDRVYRKFTTSDRTIRRD